MPRGKIEFNSPYRYLGILKRLFISAVPFILIAAIQNISAIIDVFTVRTFIETDINIKTATIGVMENISKNQKERMVCNENFIP